MSLKSIAFTTAAAYGLYKVTHPKHRQPHYYSQRPTWQGDSFVSQKAPKHRSKVLTALELFFGILLGRSLYRRFNIGGRLSELVSLLRGKITHNKSFRSAQDVEQFLMSKAANN